MDNSAITASSVTTQGPVKYLSSSSGLMPSLNMLRIQAGKQEKSEYLFIFSFWVSMQCIRAIISACKRVVRAKELVISKKWNNAKTGYCS